MARRIKYKQPRRGDKIWVGARVSEGLQPNGVIISIDWGERAVVVKFHDEQPTAPRSYYFDDIEFCWTDAFDGTYLVEEA